jgi:hypothetical protein
MKFSAENEKKKTTANFPANNPKVILQYAAGNSRENVFSQEIPQENPQKI